MIDALSARLRKLRSLRATNPARDTGPTRDQQAVAPSSIMQSALVRELVHVIAAIRRIDAGSYGRCTRCDAPIATQRLEAQPWVAHCDDCASTPLHRDEGLRSSPPEG